MRNREKRKLILEELEAQAPTMAQLKAREKPLEVPLLYFDRLPAEVWQRIQEEQSTAKPGLMVGLQAYWQNLSGLFRPSVLAAALAGIAILLIGTAMLLQQKTAPANDYTTLSSEEINDYIDHYLDDFELSLLMEEAAFNVSGPELLPEEDSLDGNAMDEYFEELLDDIDLEELL